MAGSDDLEQLAKVRFAPLSTSESKMLQAAAKGTTAFCGPSERDDDPGNNPSDSDNWSADREIRSDVIRWLCIDRAAKECLDPRGIQLHGARISGALDLSFATVNFPLRLSRCRLSDDWHLNYIDIPTIELTGTWVRSLTADVAKIRGSFILKEFCAKGRVQLRGSEIGGDLDCGGGKFQNAEIPDSGVALNADGAKVGGYVLLNNNFSAEGEVRLLNAEIVGDLNCQDGKFKNPANAKVPDSGVALNAEGAKVGGYVFLRNNFSAEGEVRVFNADIGTDLDCEGGKFKNPANAKIPGSGVVLNAIGVKVGGHVFLRNNFSADGEVRLFNANVGGNLECDGSTFQNRAKAKVPGSGVALNAEGGKFGGHVFLRNNFSADGEVRLFNANVAGNLECDGSIFQNPANDKIPGSGVALNAGGAKVGGYVFLRNNFSAEGEVRLFKGNIGSDIDCEGGKFENPANDKIPGSGVALNADGAKIGGYIFLRNNFSAEGEVRLFNAEVAGIDGEGGTFQNASGVALNAEGAKVGGYVFLRKNFSAEGEVRLFNAIVAGNLECDGSTFQNPGNAAIPDSGVALNAEGAKIGGHVFLRNEFSAEGEVRLPIADVAGNLECGGSTFQNPAKAGIPGSGVAFNADGAKVGGHVYLNSLLAEGEVRLFGAEIGGSLDCNSGNFQNPANAQTPDSVALTIEGATVGSSVFLNNNFSADGTVRLFGAEIGRSLDCSSGKFQNPANANVPGSGVALDARGVSTGGSIFLTKEFSAAGTVNFANARITSSLKFEKATFDYLDLTDALAGSILDDEESWPRKENLSLDGFVYGRISDGPLDASKRLTWVKRQSSFRRQPYRQLATILGNSGDDLGTRQVMSKMQREAWEQRGWLFRPISVLLRFTIGYGYFPLRAVWLILALVVIGSSIYWVAYNTGSIVPTQKESYAFFETHCYPSNEYERFHAVPYSLENSFPLVKLGVQDKWATAPEARVPACSSTDVTSPALRVISEPRFLRWFRWTQICLGWVLTTLFVGGVTGILRKS
jgi:hypothetical protein